MKKKLLIISASVIIAGAITYYALNTFNSFSKDSVSMKETNSENVENGGKIIEIKEKEAKPVDQEFQMDMSEYSLQDAIHGMSHQKVEAEDKWGFIPLTAERVQRLIKVVETNKETYEHASLYLSILNRWSNEDFSQVDSDHNAIWDLQNGNVGRATGILSVDEEKEFIKEHYDVE